MSGESSNVKSPGRFLLARKQQTQPSRYMIERESVTTDEIAARLGLNLERARHRMRKAKQQPGPVTWARLGL